MQRLAEMTSSYHELEAELWEARAQFETLKLAQNTHQKQNFISHQRSQGRVCISEMWPARAYTLLDELITALSLGPCSSNSTAGGSGIFDCSLFLLEEGERGLWRSLVRLLRNALEGHRVRKNIVLVDNKDAFTSSRRPEDRLTAIDGSESNLGEGLDLWSGRSLLHLEDVDSVRSSGHFYSEEDEEYNDVEPAPRSQRYMQAVEIFHRLHGHGNADTSFDRQSEDEAGENGKMRGEIGCEPEEMSDFWNVSASSFDDSDADVSSLAVAEVVAGLELEEKERLEAGGRK